MMYKAAGLFCSKTIWVQLHLDLYRWRNHSMKANPWDQVSLLNKSSTKIYLTLKTLLIVKLLKFPFQLYTSGEKTFKLRIKVLSLNHKLWVIFYHKAASYWCSCTITLCTDWPAWYQQKGYKPPKSQLHKRICFR